MLLSDDSLNEKVLEETVVTEWRFKGQVFTRIRGLMCCSMSSPRCAELLIMYHANVNHAAERGETPLYLACENGNDQCVKLLLEAGANRSARTCVSFKARFSKSAFQETEGNSFKMVCIEAFINIPKCPNA